MWRVVVLCYTDAQCGASPTTKGHGRAVQTRSGVTSHGHGQPPQHRPSWTVVTASGGAGRQRSSCRGQPSAASLTRIQPGAARSSHASASTAAPCSRRRWGIVCCRPGGGGDVPRAVPGRWATSVAQLTGLLRAHPASPCKWPAQRHLRQPRQQPQASGLQDGGGVSVWHWGGVEAVGGGGGVVFLGFFFRNGNPKESRFCVGMVTLLRVQFVVVFFFLFAWIGGGEVGWGWGVCCW